MVWDWDRVLGLGKKQKCNRVMWGKKEVEIWKGIKSFSDKSDGAGFGFGVSKKGVTPDHVGFETREKFDSVQYCSSDLVANISFATRI